MHPRSAAPTTGGDAAGGILACRGGRHARLRGRGLVVAVPEVKVRRAALARPAVGKYVEGVAFRPAGRQLEEELVARRAALAAASGLVPAHSRAGAPRGGASLCPRAQVGVLVPGVRRDVGLLGGADA